jgi:uridine nucleosidase
VHGNTDAAHAAANAARCLYAWGAPESLQVHPGASKPLLRPARHAATIHGKDGLGGVEGLPAPDSPEVLKRIVHGKPALEAMAQAVRESDSKVHIVACGPLTNIALFVNAHPELTDKVEQIVFMGGGIGMGNVTPVAGKYHHSPRLVC